MPDTVLARVCPDGSRVVVVGYLFSVDFKPPRLMVALDIGAHFIVFGTGLISVR